MKQGRLKFNRIRKLWESPILEEHVVREITERLWYAKIKVFRIRERIPQKGKRYQLSTAGIPDLAGWIPRRTEMTFGGQLYKTTGAIPLYIECKRPGGVRRPAQTRFIEEAQADGCVAFFAESWDDVVRELNKVGLKLQGEK